MHKDLYRRCHWLCRATARPLPIQKRCFAPEGLLRIVSRVATGMLMCPRAMQVEGCGAELRHLSQYCQTRSICTFHMRVSHIRRNGHRVRFCNMCRSFHRLKEFDSAKRRALCCSPWSVNRSLHPASGETVLTYDLIWVVVQSSHS